MHVKKYAKTAEPSPNLMTPNLMKLHANAANFRGFADGLTLGKASFGQEDQLNDREEFKLGT